MGHVHLGVKITNPSDEMDELAPAAPAKTRVGSTAGRLRMDARGLSWSRTPVAAQRACRSVTRPAMSNRASSLCMRLTSAPTPRQASPGG
jgi:hypothetical protein